MWIFYDCLTSLIHAHTEMCVCISIYLSVFVFLPSLTSQWDVFLAPVESVTCWILAWHDNLPTHVGMSDQ